VRSLLSLLAVALPGCIKDSPYPYVGSCAVYPDGSYEYGQIGIGTCLAAPADLRFLENGEDTVLAVSNANAFRDFSGSSVLFIDWDGLDLDQERNLLGDLQAAGKAHAVDLPHFAGTLAEVPERDLLVVPVRHSEDENTRVAFDQVHLIDISDPLNAGFADASGEGDGSTLQVQSDPYAAAYNAEDGLVFVGNRTSHTVSVIDALAEPIALLDVMGRARIGSERWFDEDHSGSNAAFSTLEVSDSSALADETWDLTYIEGSYRLWLPGEDGLHRHDSGGDGQWLESAYGVELNPEDSEDEVEEVGDPHRYESSSLGPRMLFTDRGTLRGASPAAFASDWYFDAEPLLEGREGEWDETLSGPCALTHEGLTWLFYDGTGADGTWIGVATSATGYDGLGRVWDEPLMVAGGEHDALGQADPVVFYDDSSRAWRMLYSAWDGSRWTIGQAWSDDLETWTAEDEPVFSVSSGDAAAPELAYANGRFHMYYATRAGSELPWQVAYATSYDAFEWSDEGVVLEYPGFTGSRGGPPPGLALEVEAYASFRIEGEQEGITSLHAMSGVTIESSSYGWRLRVVSGQHADLDDFGDGAINGASVSSVLAEQGLVYVDMIDEEETWSIGLADWDGEQLAPQTGAVLEAGTGGAFDQDGVSSPVVFQDDSGQFVMLYAGHGDGQVRIGRATSEDGLQWTRDSGSPVFELGTDWDSYGAWPGSVERLEDGSWRLWYSGSNGERMRIGVATSSDGTSFEQAEEEGSWIFGTGSPGDWDDTSVYHPCVLSDGEQLHLWYAGHDGEVVSIGHAVGSADTLEFERDVDEEEVPYPLLQGEYGLFDYGGVERPVLFETESGYGMFYKGLDNAVFRPGLAAGPHAEAFYKTARVPSVNDRLQFVTETGSSAVDAIDLDGEVDGYATTGTGLSELFVDQQRGFMYVASKLLSYLTVIDIRDDSQYQGDDSNYLGVEALLATDTSSGGTGFRGMTLSADGTQLYALNDSPESVFIFDLESLADDATEEVIRGAQVGYLPAPRGADRDMGASNVSSVGPSGLALLPDGHTLLVTNFNQNSVGVYDLRMGAYGQMIGEIEFLGENPHSVKVAPDGRHAVVGVYAGEVDDRTINSTLAVIDVDESSDTWLEVLTWIANQ